MTVLIGRFKEFLRYGHIYTKAMYIASSFALVIAALGLTYVLPNADAGSIQSGLTVIAELLGVFLGAILVMIVLLVEQGEQARIELRELYPKYRKQLESNRASLERAYDILMEWVKSGEVELDDPIAVVPDGAPLESTYRSVLNSIAGLHCAIDFDKRDKLAAGLRDLGYSENQITVCLYADGAIANCDAPALFELMDEALTPIVCWENNEVDDFTSDLFEKSSRDGVSENLSRLARSKNVLRSKSLAINISIMTLSTMGAVTLLFGITEDTISAYIWWIRLILIGFVLSVLMSLQLLGKAISKRD